MDTLPPGRTAVLTALAMIAFAANSLLCRGALAADRIDPVSFTAVRVASGGVALAAVAGFARRGLQQLPGSWTSALALVAYAAAFSMAYTAIPAGIGALLLFGSVQATMIGHALAQGARLRPGEWMGLAVALGGLAVLTRPGLAAPDPAGAALMIVAGMAWGVYTIRGRGHADPLRATAGNFVRGVVPMAAIGAIALALEPPRVTAPGVGLAIASGVLASGGGYAIWYSALRGLTPTRASVVQLSAPLLAAAGGVVVLGETFTARLALGAPLILGGIAIAVLVRSRR
jgi:drug/metabolite transporter (DMT)-like permease